MKTENSPRAETTFNWESEAANRVLERNRQLSEGLPEFIRNLKLLDKTNRPRDAYRTEYPGGLK